MTFTADYSKKITNLFNEVKIRELDFSDSEIWELPNKTRNNCNTRIQHTDRIPEGVKRTQRGKKYDTNYLKNLFDKIEVSLSAGVPFEILEQGKGFVFPNKRLNDSNYHQLRTKQTCENFIIKISNFDRMPKKGKNGLRVDYLLGYVGSGKSTFLNYAYLSNIEKYTKKGIVTAFFEYDEISDKLLDSKMTEDDWDIEITKLVYDKIIFKSEELDHLEHNTELSTEEKFNYLSEIARERYIILYFDGFDSLSVNKIEPHNIQNVLKSIKKTLETISSIYSKNFRLKFGCNVVFCLRKCTYETLDKSQQIGRVDLDNVSYLVAPKFDHVITSVINSLSTDLSIFKEHHDTISEIIKITTEKTSVVLGESKNKEDVFDNNYRRRLRYVCAVIIVYALRLSNVFTVSKGEDVHDLFLSELKSNIENASEHLLIDILVYGVNTGYNNHFNTADEKDNIGKLCGFVDNIFCYFCTERQESNNCKLMLKLRILQILNEEIDDKEFGYLSKSTILDKLIDLGYSDSTLERVSNILDFLEKSLFIRSSLPFIENINNKKSSNKNEVHFKCSNFGNLLLNKILMSHSYLTAVCQNTCMPSSVTCLITYKNKKLSGSQSQFIDNSWIQSIIPYLFLFIRFIKTVELENHTSSKFNIYEKMLNNSIKPIDNIFSSKNRKITDAEIDTIRRSSLRILRYRVKINIT